MFTDVSEGAMKIRTEHSFEAPKNTRDCMKPNVLERAATTGWKRYLVIDVSGQ
jgi:hypothetical protein